MLMLTATAQIICFFCLFKKISDLHRDGIGYAFICR